MKTMKPGSQKYNLPVKSNTKLSGLFVFGLITALSFITISLNKSEIADDLPSFSMAQVLKNNTGKIKDGEYQAIGNYTSPGGPETIRVKVVIKDEIIKDVSVEPQAKRAVSKRYQNEFTKNYKSFVVGKKISEIQLDKVAGSSLTPKGFNDAISEIINSPKS